MSSLSFIHQYIDSLGNKIEQVAGMLESLKSNGLVITEYSLKQNFIDTVHLNDYVIADSFTRTHHAKGGLVIFVRQNIKFSKILW